MLGTGMILWGVERSLDEHLWLGEDGRLGSDLVQLAGIALVLGGIVILVRTQSRWKEWRRTHASPGVAESGAVIEPTATAGAPADQPA